MTVWVGCGGCHTEIATAFSKPRNDRPRITRLPRIAKAILAMMVCVLSFALFVIARSETTKQSTNHHYFIHSQKRKRNHYPLPPSSLQTKQSNLQIISSKCKSKKEKEFTILVPLCHCETSQKSWQSINHKKLMQKQKRKRIYYYLSN